MKARKPSRPRGEGAGAVTKLNGNHLTSRVHREHTTQTRDRASGVTLVRRSSDNRVVGEISGEPPVLRKRARIEHRLMDPAGWGWDVAIIDQAERAGVHHTIIVCAGLVYRAALADFRRFGFPVSRGDTLQLGLAMNHWTITKLGEPPAAVQLELFGGGR